MRRIPVLAALAALLCVLAACGSTSSGGSASGGGAAPATHSAPNTIIIKNFMFSPASLTVSPGAKVTVKNEDSTAHTVTSSMKSFNTGNVAGGATMTLTAPTKPGSYSYICDIHQYMQGTLVVK
jgi:plastocyanin